ncbi:hypothetical protein BBP40_001383 [Aspergillus hancockii]|nr:hypothetical protein BBP40_001383 [Aspergillus hancockii]
MSFTPEPNWLVQIPDKPGPGTVQARQDNVGAHLAHNKIHIELGHIVLSGPAVESFEHGKPPVITGSIMVWKAHSEAELRTWLSENPYATIGVWDLEEATVTPFLCAVRKPL